MARLSTTPIAPSCAMWAQTEEDGQPYLYIVSPFIEQAGSFAANQILVGELRAFQPEGTDPFETLDPFAIKVVSPSDRLARELIEFNGHFLSTTPTWFGPGPLGSTYVEGAYIYPATMFAPVQPQPST